MFFAPVTNTTYIHRDIHKHNLTKHTTVTVEFWYCVCIAIFVHVQNGDPAVICIARATAMYMYMLHIYVHNACYLNHLGLMDIWYCCNWKWDVINCFMDGCDIFDKLIIKYAAQISCVPNISAIDHDIAWL